MKKLIHKQLVYIMLSLVVLSNFSPLTAHAADAEWRMMHGEQDALIIGTITQETDNGYKVEVAQAMWCQQDTAKGRMIPLEEVPSMMIIPEIRYTYSYHGKTAPQKDDHIFISVDQKKGEIWEQNWLAMEVSSTDPKTMEFAQPENMTNSEYAWQIFVASGGEVTSFAFEGNDILYVDGEVVFDRVKYLKELKTEKNLESPEKSEEENMAEISEEEYTAEALGEEKTIEVLEAEASSTAIIGGADGPTSIFIAGKIGRGTIAVFAGAVILILAVIVVIIKKSKKK